MTEIIRITRRKTFDSKDPAVLGFHIDRPAPGSVWDTYYLPVEGWFATSAEGPVEIKAIHRGNVIRSVKVEIPRPDVAARLQSRSEGMRLGFAMQVGMLGLPLDFEIRLVADQAEGSATILAALEGKRLGLARRFAGALNPLMITMQGRVGSTWLMKLLSEHPSIVVNPPHFGDPYETRAASYWLHMLKVLSDPADHIGSSNRLDFTDKRGWIGHHPFFTTAMTRFSGMQEWFGYLYPQMIAEFCQRSIDEYYLRVAQACGKEQPTFFAEKFHANHVPWIAWEIYPEAREIVLVRDFRDMVSSILAFNRKRGYDSFGRERVCSDLDYVEGMRANVLSFKRAWELRSDRAFLLRYEDLVLEPEATLERLLEYLRKPADVKAMIKRARAGSSELKGHRTTEDVKASIGRWKQDLKPELQEACSRAFQEALVAFGYA